MTRATVSGPFCGTYAARTTARGKPGRTRKTLMSRASTSSTMPPRKPATRPTVTESAVTTRPVAKPQRIETRVPTTSWLKISCPVWVVPSQLAVEGGTSTSFESALGSVWINSGPINATRTKKSTIQIPIVALRLRVKIRHRACARLTSGDERPQCTGAFFSAGCAPREGTTPSINGAEAVGSDLLLLDCGNMLISTAPFSNTHAHVDQGLHRP